MFTVYALSMYACVTVNDISGTLMSKTCNWIPNGGLWATEQSCRIAGEAQVGKPYFSDIADGSVYENYRCYPESVSK